MELEDKLNQQTKDKFGLRLKDATLNKKSGLCSVEIFYKDGVILSTEDREQIEQMLIQLLPKGFEYQFKFIKNYLVKEAVEDFIKKYIAREFPSVGYELVELGKQDDCRVARLAINESQLEYASHRGLAEGLSKAIATEFDNDVKVIVEPKEEGLNTEIEEEEEYYEAIDPNEGRFIEVHNIEPLIGDLTDTQAYYIKDKTVSGDEVVLCGKIVFIKDFSYVPKRKAKAEDKPETESRERKYFKFMLEDFTGKMSCTYFSNSQTEQKAAELAANDQVIVSGKIEQDNFSGGLMLMVQKISRCSLPEKFEEEIKFKPVPDKYKYVFPEPVEHYSQVDLFTGEAPKVNDFFMKHDVVVYDFETTGTRVDGSDRIVEIGAVKVHQGKIVESFSCLVNPEMHIPEKATAVHGIKDEDVAKEHTYADVLADFYKFTYGCYISGYNVEGFDNIYLTHFGRLAGYNFDNPSIDVYKLAQKSVRGVKNYKLKTIAEKLNVQLDHAHRAVYDTIATAEVLFKLADAIGEN